MSVGWISPAGNVGRVKFVEIPLQRHTIVFSAHNMAPWSVQGCWQCNARTCRMATRLPSSLFIKAVQVLQDTESCFDCTVGGEV